MAKPVLKTFGGKLKPVAALGRDRWTVSSSCGVYVARLEGASPRKVSVADRSVGNSVGAIG
jgi:hypothetical protein